MNSREHNSACRSKKLWNEIKLIELAFFSQSLATTTPISRLSPLATSASP